MFKNYLKIAFRNLLRNKAFSIINIFGLAIGLAGALLVSRLLSSFLFETSGLDPAIYLSVTGLLALTALGACWIPARRASRVDPITILHAE